MKNLFNRRVPRIVILSGMAAAVCSAQESAGAAVYKTSCASCHDGAAAGAPRLEVLRQMSPEKVVESLLYGSMRPQGTFLRRAQRLAVARFVAGKDFGAEEQPIRLCSDAPGEFHDPFSKVDSSNGNWNGWGAEATNRRFQSLEAAGLAAADVPKLKLKWAFALPLVSRMYSQPAIVGGRVFIGGPARKVYALDAKGGCAYWAFEPTTDVRGAVSVGRQLGSDPPRYAAFFVDVRANAYSVDTETGRLLWKTKVDDNPVARASGSPLLHEGRMYVPLTASEDYLGAFPTYECCKSRGAVVAIDMSDGKRIWKSETVTEPARPTRKNSRGTQLWGPSGAGVWSSPTLDKKLKRIYIATGNNYSDPATKTSDAVLALDLETGKIVWSQQFTENDAYNMACKGTSAPGSTVRKQRVPTLISAPRRSWPC